VTKQDSGGQRKGSKLAVVILAADKGRPFNGRRLTVMHTVGGRPLLRHAVATASEAASAADIFIVTANGSQQARNAVAATGVQFIEQAQGRSATDALQGAIKDYDDVVVLPGSMPLLKGETLGKLVRFHQAGHADATKLANAGVYVFRARTLAQHLDQLKADRKRGDVDLAGVDAIWREAGQIVAQLPVEDPDELLSADSIAQLVALDAKMRVSIAQRWMAAGVVIYRPETCVVDADVSIEPDTILEPFVQLLGRTKIGSGCLIRSYSVLENCTLGNDVIIRPHCVLADSAIADRAEIGPFARMRPGCEVGEQVHIGNFVELKKAKLHKGVKAGHLSYLGDTEIGEDVNIGAGVITCNYDGVHKHLTRIGDGAFIGSDSTLVAPVTIGNGAYVGAASCITKEVPADALAVGRARQIVKEGWAGERRARRKAQAAKAE